MGLFLDRCDPNICINRSAMHLLLQLRDGVGAGGAVCEGSHLR